MPIAKILKRASHKRAFASSIDSAAKTVTCSDGSKTEYDVLVVCPGARNYSPAEPPVTMADAAAARTYYDATRDAITAAKQIGIVGAGPVAIELAGEVRDANASAAVSLLVGSHRFLGNVNPRLTDKHVAYVLKQMAARDVNVVIGDDVVSPALPVDLLTSSAVFRDVDVVFHSGKTLHFDLLLFAVGGQLRAKAFVPADWLNVATGEIVIDDVFRVKGQGSVFAFGDAAHTGRTKMGAWAIDDAKAVAANVTAVAAGKAPTKTVAKARGPFIVLPVGERYGITVLGSTVWFGNWSAATIKGKDLFLSMTWGMLQAGKPPSSSA